MKKYIIGFIVGILVSSIGVYAITASEIDYKDTKLDQALDTLYNNVGKVNLDRISFSANSYQGKKTMGTKTSIELESGNYVVIGIQAFHSPAGSNPGTTSTSTTANNPGINQTTDTCTKLGTRATTTVPTTTYDSKYQRLYLQTNLWKCSFNETTTVEIIENSMGASNDNLALSMIVEAIKLD